MNDNSIIVSEEFRDLLVDDNGVLTLLGCFAAVSLAIEILRLIRIDIKGDN